MVNNLINTSSDRFTKKTGILQIEIAANTYQLKFTQRFFSSINLNSFDEDYIDDQSPVWTQRGNKIGDAEVDLIDTVDLYDTATPATNVNTVSYWREQIKKGIPAKITFQTVKNAPNSAGDKFAREKFTGEIIDVSNEERVDDALLDAKLTIRLTDYVSGLRSAS
ncbi:MAG: hypothetical protein KC444_09245 [Nitrosopumilus sp.]|nr:hypothetical protein [Nitrosopumilus sp.]